MSTLTTTASWALGAVMIGAFAWLLIKLLKEREEEKKMMKGKHKK